MGMSRERISEVGKQFGLKDEIIKAVDRLLEIEKQGEYADSGAISAAKKIILFKINKSINQFDSILKRKILELKKAVSEENWDEIASLRKQLKP